MARGYPPYPMTRSPSGRPPPAPAPSRSPDGITRGTHRRAPAAPCPAQRPARTSRHGLETRVTWPHGDGAPGWPPTVSPPAPTAEAGETGQNSMHGFWAELTETPVPYQEPPLITPKNAHGTPGHLGQDAGPAPGSRLQTPKTVALIDLRVDAQAGRSPCSRGPFRGQARPAWLSRRCDVTQGSRASWLRRR